MNKPTYRERTILELEAEAQALRVNSGFRMTIEQARNRVAEAHGWVSFKHCLECKQSRGAK